MPDAAFLICIKDSVFIDWACGTCGFLVSALDYMQKQVTPGDTEAQKALQTCVRGGELKPMAYKLGITNLLLHDIELPNLRYGDSLAEKNLNEFRGRLESSIWRSCTSRRPSEFPDGPSIL